MVTVHLAISVLHMCFFGDGPLGGGWIRHLSLLVDSQYSGFLIGVRGFPDLRFGELGVP